MCRLILAHGQFDSQQVMQAAADMSLGLTADHDGPTQVHPNGWGAVWRTTNGDTRLQAHRSAEALSIEALRAAPLWDVPMDLLALHARHATVPSQLGLGFTHPLERRGAGGTWYFMHNGFTPTIYPLLGKAQSHFDSLDYFEYLIDPDRTDLDPAQALSKLKRLPEGGSAANAIAVNQQCAYLVHYVFPGTRCRRYFQMHRLGLPSGTVYASEVLPQLAPAARWNALEPQHILKVNL